MTTTRDPMDFRRYSSSLPRQLILPLWTWFLVYQKKRYVMYASTWNRAPETQAVTVIIHFGGQELATLKSNEMRSAEYSTGSHEHTAIVLSSPEIMCSCVFKGNYINLGITETSGWTHLCWGCCPMSSRIFKQHPWPLVTRFQEVHLEKKISWALSSDPCGANSLGLKTSSPAHSTNRRILQDLR